MLNVGTPELAVLVVLAFVVLGPSRLPEVARQAGRAVSAVRRMGDEVRREISDAVQS